MASAECCSYSPPNPHSHSHSHYGADQNSAYSAPPAPCGFNAVSYEDVCWAISRASKRETLGYYIAYLRYVRYHHAYAKTVERAWLKRGNSKRNHSDRSNAELNHSESERVIKKGQHQPQMEQEQATNHRSSERSQIPAPQQWLQQHEEAFCHALHQQLIELNGRD